MPETVLTPGRRRAASILRAAREVFLERGWDHFSIERIAEYAECSRPLVYKHFSSKEEILLALAIESKSRRVRLFERAIDFKGRPREKMLAVGEVEEILFERDLPIEMFVASTALRAKTSIQRQEQLKVIDVRAVSMSASIIREAVAEGDLTLPAPMRPEDMLFALWAIRWGAANIIRSDTPIDHAGIQHPEGAVLYSLSAMLDGYKWRPLSSEMDYRATRERVYKEIFTREVLDEILGRNE